MALDGLFGPQFDLLQQGMGLAARRQGLLMRNLANANVPGYKRQDLDFRVQLNDRLSLRSGGSSAGGAVRFDGSSVDPEREVVAIAETEGRYTALAEITSREFSMLRSAIREGR